MGGRLLLIGLGGFQIIVGMNSDENDKEIVTAHLKKINDYARSAYTADKFLINLKEFLLGLSDSPVLLPLADSVTEFHIKELPAPLTKDFSTSEDLLVKWQLFSPMNENNKTKLITRLLNNRRLELLTQLILSDGKEMTRLFPTGSYLHTQIGDLLPEFIKVTEGKLSRKKVVAFFAGIEIDFTKIDNTQLFNAAVTVNSASLVELFLVVGTQRVTHLTTLTPPTHFAASLPDGQKLLDTLYKHDFSPNAQDPKSMSTVLMIYCSKPETSIETIEKHVARGVDLNLMNKAEATALTCACLSGFWQAALFLLDQETLSLGYPPYTAPKGKTQYEKTLDAIEKRLDLLNPKKMDKKKKKIEEYKQITDPTEQATKLKSLIKSCSKIDSQAH